MVSWRERPAAETAPLEGYGRGAAVAKSGVCGIAADGFAVAPAAFAFGGGGFGRHRGVGLTGFEFEFAQDEKLFFRDYAFAHVKMSELGQEKNLLSEFDYNSQQATGGYIEPSSN